MTAPPVPELSRMAPLDRVGGRGATFEVTASEAERLAVAERLGIVGVASLECRFVLTGQADDASVIVAEGDLAAEVAQVCVVTLESFESFVRERFRLRFVPAERGFADEDPESDDEVAYEGVAIDLGEAAVEQLALALDPFPRRPGARLPDLDADEPPGAFAALSALRRPEGAA